MSIVIKTSIDINAPAQDVWAVLTDFAAYGEWSNFSSIDGVAQAGTRLAMKMPGMSFGSTVTAATPEQKLEWAAWIVNKIIFEGRHSFTLTRNPDGSTHLDNTETFRVAWFGPSRACSSRRRVAEPTAMTASIRPSSSGWRRSPSPAKAKLRGSEGVSQPLPQKLTCDLLFPASRLTPRGCAPSPLSFST